MGQAAKIKVLVLRCRSLERSEAFYRLLGLEFTRHRHGKEPEHLACEAEGMVFELYPRLSDADSTNGARLGFRVPSVYDAVAALERQGAPLLTAPRASEWGLRAVVADPDGHKVELAEA